MGLVSKPKPKDAPPPLTDAQKKIVLDAGNNAAEALQAYDAFKRWMSQGGEKHLKAVFDGYKKVADGKLAFDKFSAILRDQTKTKAAADAANRFVLFVNRMNGGR